MTHGLLSSLARVTEARTLRASSWDTSGRNADYWRVEPGLARVLADIAGPGCITHLWMTQGPGGENYRKILLRIFWDDEKAPSILAPLGDFFCLGHSIVNSFCSIPFSSSTRNNNRFGSGAALNCYLQMPFRRRARIEVVNEGEASYGQYFYVDYETYATPLPEDIAYLHAQWRRENPCDGWGHEVRVNTKQADIVNKEQLAWNNNYLILEAEGAGHYIGCNLSVSNFQGTWWGEGDDMIWVDGYHWPPDLHGTGSEDYLNQAWGMQDNAFLFNGSSIHEQNTNGYQTSYVFHLTNPVRFRKSIRATIEHGHGNHLANECSSTAYWYQLEPHKPFGILPMKQRLPARRTAAGEWITDKDRQTPQRPIKLNAEMCKMKREWAKLQKGKK
jgi:hypothetical protein